MIATLAPAAPRPWAMPRLMPLDPPAMKAVLPASRPGVNVSIFSSPGVRRYNRSLLGLLLQERAAMATGRIEYARGVGGGGGGGGRGGTVSQAATWTATSGR